MIIFSVRAVRIIFFAFVFLSGYADAQRGWNENIAIDSYIVECDCSYGNDKDRDYRFIKKNDRLAVEKYIIKLKSKYNMFANYNNYYSSSGRVQIQSDLHEVNPSVKFLSKADIEFHLNGEQFDKLIQVDEFLVYYPMSIFDYRWVKKVSEKSNSNELSFSTELSSVGLERYRKHCHDTIESQRVGFEKENNKPVNRLKNFFL